MVFFVGHFFNMTDRETHSMLDEEKNTVPPPKKEDGIRCRRGVTAELWKQITKISCEK